MIYYGINPESLGQLGGIGKQVRKWKDSTAIIKIKFLRPYGIAYLDQLMERICEQHPSLRIASTYGELNQYLKQCGFSRLADGYPLHSAFPQEDIIRVQRFTGDSLAVETKVVDWMKADLLRFIPRLSPQLSKKIVENLWEIVNNGLMHGRTSNGVSAAGQFYPAMGYFEMAFYEKGLGIPNVVRAFGAVSASASDADCINWAIQMGNTTKPPGGLGLHLLREFLKVNRGSIQIVSGDGYFGQFGTDAPSFQTLRNPIAGTLVNIRVVFDDKLYQLKGEDV